MAEAARDWESLFDQHMGGAATEPERPEPVEATKAEQLTERRAAEELLELAEAGKVAIWEEGAGLRFGYPEAGQSYRRVRRLFEAGGVGELLRRGALPIGVARKAGPPRP